MELEHYKDTFFDDKFAIFEINKKQKDESLDEYIVNNIYEDAKNIDFNKVETKLKIIYQNKNIINMLKQKCYIFNNFYDDESNNLEDNCEETTYYWLISLYVKKHR